MTEAAHKNDNAALYASSMAQEAATRTWQARCDGLKEAIARFTNNGDTEKLFKAVAKLDELQLDCSQSSEGDEVDLRSGKLPHQVMERPEVQLC